MKTAGLDIGTTGCKCTVFDENGRYLDKAYRDYPVRRRITGHEIDMQVLTESVLECIEEMAGKYPDIAGIGVTSFGETFVLTDEEGRPLHTAMLYTDPRGNGECRRLVERLTEERIAAITGMRPHEMYGISKMMWLRDNEPGMYSQAKHVFQVEDLIVYILSGKAQIDYSLATRSMAFDITTLKWSDEILDTAGIEKSLFPEAVPSGTPAGRIKKDMAEKLGLSQDTVIVSIGQDQIAAAAGAGAFDGSVAVDGAGTVECLTPIYDSRPDIEKMSRGYFAVVPYVVSGKYAAYAFSYTGGALTRWCVDTIAGEEKKLAESLGISVNELLEKQYAKKMTELGLSPDEPSGLLVLPHFAGAATPYMDTGSRGAILGLTTDTGACEIYRGCLEGVCYEMYVNYKALSDTGIRFKKLHATGGGSKSAVWMQMKADVLGLPITAMKTVDAGTVGCAMLTGIAAGQFKDLNEASAMIQPSVTYEPRADMHEKYMEHFKRYERLYGAVRPLMQTV